MGNYPPELALADEHVALALQHVTRQKEIIDAFQRAGHPTALAEDLLVAFEDTLATHIQHRDRILAELG